MLNRDRAQYTTMINVFIAGAQKAGTTSIKSFLASHPDVISHPQMEMTHFFIDEEFKRGDKNLKEKYGFDLKINNKVLVAKHAIHTMSDKAIERLYQHNSECKVIFCTRNPVERAFSSYLMEKRNGSVKEDFDEVVDIALREKSNHWFYRVFVDLGIYENHINKILRFFPKNQVMVIALEDFKNENIKETSKLLNWLGLEPFEKELKSSNTRSEVSTHKLKLLVQRVPFLKMFLMRFLSMNSREKIGRLVSKLMGIGINGQYESLQMYPTAKIALEEFYKKFK